jgi:hypothetical protein
MLQTGGAVCSSVTTTSHALEDFVGHVEWFQRSLIFAHSRLEQGPTSYIYGRSAPHPSRDKIDVFMLKDASTDRPPTERARVGSRRS